MTNQMRLVDLDKSLALIDRQCLNSDDDEISFHMVKTILLGCVVDPVRHGHWIPTSKPYDFNMVKCSQCERTYHLAYNYCPGCGAEMDEVIDEH